jgi:hypothetical protein
LIFKIAVTKQELTAIFLLRTLVQDSLKHCDKLPYEI